MSVLAKVPLEVVCRGSLQTRQRNRQLSIIIVVTGCTVAIDGNRAGQAGPRRKKDIAIITLAFCASSLSPFGAALPFFPFPALPFPAAPWPSCFPSSTHSFRISVASVSSPPSPLLTSPIQRRKDTSCSWSSPSPYSES